jgi:hypothetical protein
LCVNRNVKRAYISGSSPETIAWNLFKIAKGYKQFTNNPMKLMFSIIEI